MKQKERSPAVAYAAKSTADKHGSIPTQLADARALAERDGLELVAEFADEAASGFSGDRGPGLADALAECERLAAEGEVALVVQHSDRLARGDGRAAKHLVEHALWALKTGVKIRSVQDPQTFGDLLYAVVTGQRNHEDSARKSAAVKDGKRRQAERGQHLGGPLPDGYMVGAPGTPRIDPYREDVVRSIFALAIKGVPDAAIARSLNARGITTRKGNAWTRRAVQDLLTRPFYAGRIVHRGETFEGTHARLIEPADWDRMMAARADRDLGEGRHTVGRPAKLHALQRLAVCGHCGRRMVSWTSAYTRKDGSKQRTYRCPGYHEANDSCAGSQIAAPTVDAAVLAALGDLLPDFDSWLARVIERQSGERHRLEAIAETARTERDKQARRAAAVEAKWADYAAESDDKAALVLPMVERERQALADAATRERATEDALAAVPVEAPADALLDFAAALQRALKGIDTTGSMGQVNAALAEVFDGFAIWREADAIQIEPLLHMSVAYALIEQGKGEPGSTWTPWLIPEDPEPPPMRWLSEPLETGSTPSCSA